MKKILIITDAFTPQINGVVRTLLSVTDILKNEYDISFLEPSYFYTISCPTYPEIRLACNVWKSVEYINKLKPDYIHIATEGPIGAFCKIYLDIKRINYTTSYHTMFPEYISSRFYVPLWMSYMYFRWFHSKSKNVLATTSSMKEILDYNKFKNVSIWTRGIDTTIFKFNNNATSKSDKPLLGYVGRISIEKNLSIFFEQKHPIIVVGGGPLLETYKKKFPHIDFVGYKNGTELSDAYNNMDAFVFPSKSDTFGLVIIEALACGVPVLAYNVQGPKDIIKHGYNGLLANTDIEFIDYMKTIHKIPKENCIESSKEYTWEICAELFKKSLIKTRI